jgi:sec-independent protein translocase protein TatA
MFGNAFGWPHLIVILLVVLLLFGATRLPALSKSLGQSMRIFRKEVKSMKDDDQPPASPPSAANDGAGTVPDAHVDSTAPAASVPESQNKPKP